MFRHYRNIFKYRNFRYVHTQNSNKKEALEQKAELYTNIYLSGLKLIAPVTIITSTMFGIFTCGNVLDKPNHNDFAFINHIIKHLSYGVLISYTYPISFPAIAIYTTIANDSNKASKK